jgi:hypothetical protein
VKVAVVQSGRFRILLKLFHRQLPAIFRTRCGCLLEVFSMRSKEMATTTCHRVFQTLSRLACGIVAAAALLATNPAPAATLNAFMYGINDNNEIYEVNPVDKTSRLLLIGSSEVLGSTANSVGYDDVRNHLFFLGADSVFRYWSRATNQIQDVQGLSCQSALKTGQ